MVWMRPTKLAIETPRWKTEGGQAVAKVSGRCAAIEFVTTMTYVALCVPVQILSSANVAEFYAVVVILLTFAFRRETVAQMNPVGSFSFMMTGKITVQQCVANVVCQLAGACIGAAWVAVWIRNAQDPSIELGSTMGYEGGAGYTRGRIFFAETISSWLYIVTMIQATHPSTRQNAFFGCVFIGLSYYVALSITLGLTGGMINPARSFGTAIIASIKRTSQDPSVPSKELWNRHWMGWVAPLVGGTYAIVTDFFLSNFKQTKNAEAPAWFEV